MPKIKLSEIRAKYPMYADVSDDQLLIGLRQKFYSDIPPAKFYGSIEYDNGPDPTEGMSTGEKLLAGVGAGMTNLARGVGQMVGAVDRQDVAESRRLDAPLMRTTPGMVGNVAGSVAPMIPLAFVPGANTYAGAAAIGAGTGLAAPSESTGETLRNIGIGGVAGPASIAAGRAIGAGIGAARGLVEPFTKRGQENIAARTLRQFATDPNAAAAKLRAAQELVPGSRPTMAQASDDAGLAQLERTLRNNPETGPALTELLGTQRTARLKAVQDIAGTDEYYSGVKEGIRTFAKEDYDRAIAAGFDPEAMAKAAPRLDAVLQRPSVQAAQGVAKRLAAENGEKLTDLGSIRGLDYLMKAIDNKISAAAGVGSSVGKEELRALTKTKADLMGIVEEVAPAYKEARANFAAMSKQKNAMDVSRDLLGRMQSPLARQGANTRELKNEYARALEGAIDSTKRQTGMDMPLSAFMPEADLKALNNVARDMARGANADDLGRAVGSNTAQNLAAQNLLRRVLGPGGLPESWAESNALQAFLSPYTGVARLAGSERAVLDRLAAAAANPQDAAGLLQMVQQPSRMGLLGADALRFLPPMLPAGLLSANGR